jgi:hypothetical protein
MSSGANGEVQSLAAKAPISAEFNFSEAMAEKLEQFADAQIITQAGELYDRKGERADSVAEIISELKKVAGISWLFRLPFSLAVALIQSSDYFLQAIFGTNLRISESRNRKVRLTKHLIRLTEYLFMLI